jgi:peptidoglycan/LPS O-acetylase OafA/YrhL
MESQLPGQLLFYGLAGALAFGVAWVSWHGFEKHFLSLKKRFPLEGGSLEAAAASSADPVPAGIIARWQPVSRPLLVTAAAVSLLGVAAAVSCVNS